MHLSNSEINRLGDRLRQPGAISPDDLEMLQVLRREYQTAMHDAQDILMARLGDAGTTTSRLKTVQTLVGKLRREAGMDLARVQDIAGLRIVRGMTLAEQSDLSARIANLVEGARVIDRRERPSYGYRAVHVVARVDGRLVEIQIRTALQDRWAQIVERMADPWGRQIRYGEPPNEPNDRIGKTSRAFVVELVRRLSPIIEAAEQARSARHLTVRGDVYEEQVVQVLGQIAALPALSAET